MYLLVYAGYVPPGIYTPVLPWVHPTHPGVPRTALGVPSVLRRGPGLNSENNNENKGPGRPLFLKSVTVVREVVRLVTPLFRVLKTERLDRRRVSSHQIPYETGLTLRSGYSLGCLRTIRCHTLSARFCTNCPSP